MRNSRIPGSRNRCRVVTGAALAVLALGACEIKSSAFFEPGTLDASLLPDIDRPVVTNLFPITGLQGPQNVDVIRFDLADGASSNGAPQSGINPTSVRLSVNGTNLPVTAAGNTWTGNLTGVADGPLSVGVSASDAAGNTGTIDWTFLLKRADPIIVFTSTPPASWQSSALSASLTYAGTIADPFLSSALGALWMPGPDAQCGTADDAPWLKGTGPGQVSENMWSYGLSGTFSASFTGYNPVGQGGQFVQSNYCFGVTSGDNAGNGLGGSNPNLAIKYAGSLLRWDEPTPTTGSIAGRVTVGGSTPLAGVTVQTGTRTTQTASDGTYRFDNLQPGSHNVAVSNLPGGVTCSPSSKSTSVIAGGTSTLDFSCSQAPAFNVSLIGTYRHFSGFSRVCLRITTSPAQPGANYSASVTGPSGGVSGTGQHSGVLDGTGAANVSNDIFLFGTYNWLANVMGQTASTSINVTAAAGTCTL